MISWIVASHDRGVLARDLLASLDPDGSTNNDTWRRYRKTGGDIEARGLHGVAQGDELIVVRDASSIAQAYNLGQDHALYPIRCYVHHDVRIRNLHGLRLLLAGTCTAELGLVGVIGSREPHVPWWDAPGKIGSVIDSRMGRIDFGGAGRAAFLDGLLLATARTVLWDTRFTGWHMYDHDQCMQQLAEGRANYVIPGGADLVEHHNGNSSDVGQLAGWAQAARLMSEKWFR